MAGLGIFDQPKLNQEQTKGRFTGQAAIVTGGAGGIGGMIVQRFLNDGASVAILDLNEDMGKEKTKELCDAGFDRVRFVPYLHFLSYSFSLLVLIHTKYLLLNRY